MSVKFGTDGWRAIIAKDFTFENVERLSQAVSNYLLNKKKSPRVVIGFDTRFLSQEFAKASSCVFCANNISVVLSKSFLPTPALSFKTKFGGFDLGIMITASHNPYYFNGYKIKKSTGAAADNTLTQQIEALMDKNSVKKIDFKKALDSGLLKIEDFKSEYVKFLRRYIDLKVIKKKRLRICIDSMYGACNKIFSDLLKGTHVKLNFIRDRVNPYFDGGRPEPTESNLSRLKKEMKKKKFDLGLAFDGDGDRLAAFTEKGEFIHPQIILPLLCEYLYNSRNWRGSVVKTVVGSFLIDKVCEKLGLPVREVPIGFKYISAVFEREEVLIGGEEAGGIGFKNYIPERDGSLAGLLLLEMIAVSKKKISQILKDFYKKYGRFYYLREDIPISKREINLEKIKLPSELLGRKIININRLDGIKLITSQSWLMFRKSGTEPLVRIYAEAQTKREAKELITLGKKILFNNAV